MYLTQNNFQIFAAHYYDNPQCLSEEEFHKDIATLSNLKRYVRRFLNDENICIKMITNTVITFYNVFDHNAATKMIKQKFTEEDETININTFLVFLNFQRINNKYNKELLQELQDTYR